MILQAVQKGGDNPPCFAVETLRTLTKLADVTLGIDGGASHIGKSRSRHFWNALQSQADAWVSVDDDVSADYQALSTLLGAVQSVHPRVCIAPCVLRNGETVNVNWSPVVYGRSCGGGTVRRAVSGGFGLVAMNREAMLVAAHAAPSWKDPHDGALKPAPFLEMLTDDGEWIGEDIAFFRRLPREVEVEALTSGVTNHAGYKLALEKLR